MKAFHKASTLIVLIMSCSANLQAATLYVTNELAEEPGGIVEVLAAAQTGDTIKFSTEYSLFPLFLDHPLIIDKAVHIDGSDLEEGVIIQGAQPTFETNVAAIDINTQGDSRPVKLSKVTFSNVFQFIPLRATNSKLICSYCLFQNNFNVFGSAGIVSSNSDVAVLNSIFVGGQGSGGTAYSGDGDLFMVNSFAIDVFADYPGGGVFKGTGEDQLFYVRNSTVSHNLGAAFELNHRVGSRSILDLRHSIVIGNFPFHENGIFDINANTMSRGYNLIGTFADGLLFNGESSDRTVVDSLDVFVDSNQSGDISVHDFTIPPGVNAVRPFPTLALNTQGLAYNYGDPLFSAFEVLLDFRRIPSAFLLPILESLYKGDIYGNGHQRIAGGRMDIGAYEMPDSQ